MPEGTNVPRPAIAIFSKGSHDWGDYPSDCEDHSHDCLHSQVRNHVGLVLVLLFKLSQIFTSLDIFMVMVINHGPQSWSSSSSWSLRSSWSLWLSVSYWSSQLGHHGRHGHHGHHGHDGHHGGHQWLPCSKATDKKATSSLFVSWFFVSAKGNHEN